MLEEGLIVQQEVSAHLEPLMEDFCLDIGEAEAILLARESDKPCAIDDGPAIRCCKALGVESVATMRRSGRS